VRDGLPCRGLCTRKNKPADNRMGGHWSADADGVVCNQFVGPGHIVTGTKVVSGSGKNGSGIGIGNEQTPNRPGPPLALKVELTVPAPCALGRVETDVKCPGGCGNTGALHRCGSRPVNGNIADRDVFAIPDPIPGRFPRW